MAFNPSQSDPDPLKWPIKSAQHTNPIQFKQTNIPGQPNSNDLKENISTQPIYPLVFYHNPFHPETKILSQSSSSSETDPHKLKTSIDLFNLVPLKHLIREVEMRAKNETETATIAEDVNFISDYIKKSMAAMKHDFKKE